MKKRISAVLFLLMFLGAASVALGAKTPPNWKEWNMFPKGADAPRYTAERVQELLVSGEKMVFVYAGYQTDTVICGSIFLPYNWVPPVGSGSRVSLNIPKDTWMVAY